MAENTHQNQAYNTLVEDGESLVGKTVLITGCTSGIGKETALQIAKTGARVVMACRNVEKARAVQEEVMQTTGSTNIVYKHLNLTCQQSIRDFAQDFLQNEARLDILINNAGVFKARREVTKEGHELMFATNHLGHFLLTHLLLNKLIESAPSRVVIVSSKLHEDNQFNFDDLNCEVNYSGTVAYGRSKSANLLFATKLAEMLDGKGVTVYSLHPGVVLTELQRDFTLLQYSLVQFLFGIAMRCFSGQSVVSASTAVQTVLYCSLEPLLAQQTGLYYVNCKVEKAAGHAIDTEAAERLWTLSCQLCDLTDKEGIQDIRD